MNIRTVAVEFLRSGPRHNQLLSPLTPYLAVCGDSPAGLVNLPYEQAIFERRRDELRYAITSQEDPGRRLGVLDQTGREMAQVLADVPGLPGALSGRRDESEVLHLRIVISASELALLPFELAKLPIRSGIPSDTWLLLQAHVPVCLTRHNRSVKSEGIKWPKKPRILFVSGEEVPFAEHRDALMRALHPWVGASGQVSDWLTICENATIQHLMNATASEQYTHVHILAHGAEFKDNKRDGYGVNLKGSVVSGWELANALFCVSSDGIRRPTVVTLATCDSGGQGSPVNPDVSVAHDLHEAGIPLVVASQFPLSTRGSVPFVETFYSDQLWGIHPLVSLYRIRLLLHAIYNQQYHDWASLVAYEALPANLDDQLHDLRYSQVREVLEGALTRLESASRQSDPPTPEQYQQLLDELEEARCKLPKSGPFEAECLGLAAASSKRLAEVEYRLAQNTKGDASAAHARACYTCLCKAHAGYVKGANAFLRVGEQSVHRKATLHWLLGQAVSMECVLGHPFRKDAWMAALFSAKSELGQGNREADQWGDGTLAELYLMRLADPAMSAEETKEAREKCLHHAGELLAKNGLMSESVFSTHRQMERYLTWWSQPDFSKTMEPFRIGEKGHWHKEAGLVATGREAAQLLAVAAQRPVVVTRSNGTPQVDLASVPPAVTVPDPAAVAEATPAVSVVIAADRSGSGMDGAATSTFTVEMLPAENGDCLWIEYGATANPRRLIIDCGAPSAARSLEKRVGQMDTAQRDFELFVLTHIDSDHISGVLPFFRKLPGGTRFREVWFNGWQQVPKEKLGVRQGEEFSALLSEPQFRAVWNRSFGERHGAAAPVEVPAVGSLPSVTLMDGLRITVLSPGMIQLQDLARKWLEGLMELNPDKTASDFLAGKKPDEITDFANFDLQQLADRKAPPDGSVANGSSIALLLEFDGEAALLTGDAHADVVVSSIRRLLRERGQEEGSRLRLSAMKLSHHGSRNALTKELLDAIDCPKYLISTNGSKFYHPDRDAVARVIVYGGHQPTLCFNYRSPLNSLWENALLQGKYGYKTIYPDPENPPGLTVRLLRTEATSGPVPAPLDAPGRAKARGGRREVRA